MMNGFYNNHKVSSVIEFICSNKINVSIVNINVYYILSKIYDPLMYYIYMILADPDHFVALLYISVSQTMGRKTFLMGRDSRLLRLHLFIYGILFLGGGRIPNKD